MSPCLLWAGRDTRAASKRVPADSSQGLCLAPCCCAEQKDWSQLLLAHGDGVSQQGRSEVSLGLCWQQEDSAAGAQEGKVLKCSSGETPTGLLVLPCHDVQLVGFSGQQGFTLTVQRLRGWSQLRRAEEVGRGGNVPQPPLVFMCSVFPLESHCTWFHADGSWSLGGSYSSVKSVSCSVVRPLLPCTQSHFPDSPQPL